MTNRHEPKGEIAASCLRPARAWTIVSLFAVLLLSSGCGGGMDPSTYQTTCTKVNACVQSGKASEAVNHIEDLTGTQFRFILGIAYPVKDDSVWTLRLRFADAGTKATIEDDVRNISTFHPCDGNSHVEVAASTPSGRDVCIDPSGSSTIVWYLSGGLLHAVYLLPPKPTIDQQQLDGVLSAYVDALR